MYQPLKGVKVIDCSLAGSAPSCTKLLTEFGASTIWIEPAAGTSTRSVHKFDFYTTGKRAVSINLKTPEGKAIFHRLLEDADVFVTNYRIRALEKLGIDYDTLHARYPRLIYGLLTGYGPEGEECNHPGYDVSVFWGKGGMLRDFAEQGTILPPPIAVGDISTGMALFGGISAALYGRRQTGQGCKVMASLLGTAMYLNHDAIIEAQYGEVYPKTRRAPRRALGNTYCCSDGKWFVLAILSDFDRYFEPLLTKVIDRPDLVGDPRWQCIEDTMYERAPEFVRILDDAFSKMTREEAVRRLNAIDAPFNVIQGSEDVTSDPQILQNKFLYKLEATVPPVRENGDREIFVPASPIKLNEIDSGTLGHERGPRVGEHTVEVLREYGYSDETIQRLFAEQIIHGETMGLENT